MRSAIIAAAFAAGALAIPMEKRAMVTEVDMVYATEYITVTAGQALPTVAAPEVAVTTVAAHNHFGHKAHGHPKKPSSSQAPAPSSEAPAPSSEAPAPSSEAPATTEYQAISWAQPEPSSTPEASPSQGSDSGSGSSAPSAPASGSYKDLVLYHHNIHRANHSAPDIEWDDGLATTAGIIAATCIYEHQMDTNGGNYGQNIAAGVSSNDIGNVITDMFYNGEVNAYPGYGEANPDMTNFHIWGHFSQVVWKASTHVGCATFDCSGRGLAKTSSNTPPYFTVCNYNKPGNFGGEYGDNVLAPLGHPTAYGSQS